jgi:hypothetical protein
MGAIEDEEQAMFRQFFESDMLPCNCTPTGLKALRCVGAKVGRPLGDFVRVRLPDGWKKRTQQTHYVEICDAKGVERALCFAKITVYDRRTSMTVHSRYTTQPTTGSSSYTAYDRETKQVLWPNASGDAAYPEVEAWLNEHYPQWHDPSLYWSDIVERRRWWRFWN